ncbi:MAG TPA: type I 3-dehydroquinate dehydratase [Bacillota bacterium]|jgi:3-dehydroquinate dehydratase-1|nr:type I 3-dehydroquinate dehydratase [Bacillota bacterium]HQE66147.1 type I 3-dehydroquinate dehydratase [Bacillota bacterium]HQJ37040.1 type I 3-dehydroquinate dehydratase [Bacillota bacterium]HQL36505.1 type I 3-dehydroquinate dehydratase [Bacillota bacterium]HRS20349.1 type I 3-dehydroquinate dehydratase [Clostridia bacterium]
MRLQPRKPVSLRGEVIGGNDPLICIPIVAEEEKELEQAAGKIVELHPDIIEWRADCYKDVCDIVKVKKALKTLRGIIKEVPLIFTFRSSLEGGFQKVDDDLRYEIIKQAINTGEADTIDIELISGKKNIDKIKAAADKYHIPLIISYHNFQETPPVEFLTDLARQQVACGADIAKIAVMPKSEEDVLNLLMATLRIRREMPDTPLITMSMGNIGVISRIAGGIFGSDLTFGASEKTSAPGQIPIAELRASMKTLLR